MKILVGKVPFGEEAYFPIVKAIITSQKLLNREPFYNETPYSPLFTTTKQPFRSSMPTNLLLNRPQIFINHQGLHLTLLLLSLRNALEIRQGRNSHRLFGVVLENKSDFESCVDSCSVSHGIYFVYFNYESRGTNHLLTREGMKGRYYLPSRISLWLCFKSRENIPVTC